MATYQPGDTRVTICHDELVQVERLLPDGRWEPREYAVDAHGWLVEVRDSTMMRVEPGLGSVMDGGPAAVEGRLVDAVLLELARAGAALDRAAARVMPNGPEAGGKLRQDSALAAWRRIRDGFIPLRIPVPTSARWMGFGPDRAWSNYSHPARSRDDTD